MLLSIIVPVFNAAPFLPELIASLSGFKRDDIEFIFIDDCSTDNSLADLESLVSDVPNFNVIVLRNAENLGLSISGLRNQMRNIFGLLTVTTLLM